jgi:hypothetical protein
MSNLKSFFFRLKDSNIPHEVLQTFHVMLRDAHYRLRRAGSKRFKLST